MKILIAYAFAGMLLFTEAFPQSVNVTSQGVGIGAVNPQGALSVLLNNEDVLNVYSPASNTAAVQTLLDNQTLSGYGTYGGDMENRLVLQPLVGNVGIGTGSPQGKLSISFNDGDVLNFFSSANNTIAIRALLNYGTYGGDTQNKLLLQPLVGNVGIGTSNVFYKLNVNGTVRAKSFLSDPSNWADDVFEPDYKLASLADVESHIKEKKHLPGVPSAKHVMENGVNLGDMQVVLLRKIEELTLHVIAQEKAIDKLQKENEVLKVRIQ